MSLPPPALPALPRRWPTRAVISHLSYPIALPLSRLLLLLFLLPPLHPPPTAHRALYTQRPRASRCTVITSSSLDDGPGESAERVLINQLAAPRANRSRHTLRHAYRLTVDQSPTVDAGRGRGRLSSSRPVPPPRPPCPADVVNP